MDKDTFVVDLFGTKFNDVTLFKLFPNMIYLSIQPENT